jgi:hypothetical protein
MTKHNFMVLYGNGKPTTQNRKPRNPKPSIIKSQNMHYSKTKQIKDNMSHDMTGQHITTHKLTYHDITKHSITSQSTACNTHKIVFLFLVQQLMCPTPFSEAFSSRDSCRNEQATCNPALHSCATRACMVLFALASVEQIQWQSHKSAIGVRAKLKGVQSYSVNQIVGLFDKAHSQ